MRVHQPLLGASGSNSWPWLHASFNIYESITSYSAQMASPASLKALMPLAQYVICCPCCALSKWGNPSLTSPLKSDFVIRIRAVLGPVGSSFTSDRVLYSSARAFVLFDGCQKAFQEHVIVTTSGEFKRCKNSMDTPNAGGGRFERSSRCLHTTCPNSS